MAEFNKILLIILGIPISIIAFCFVWLITRPYIFIGKTTGNWIWKLAEPLIKLIPMVKIINFIGYSILALVVGILGVSVITTILNARFNT